MINKIEKCDDKNLETLDYRDVYSWVMSAVATILFALVAGILYFVEEPGVNGLYLTSVLVALTLFTFYLYKKFKKVLSEHNDKKRVN